GRSLGTGIATYVASEYHPKMLILEAPYYSILELASSELRWIPGFIVKSLLKYHFRTDLWIQKVKAPIFLFHGTHDQTIPFQSSKRLEKLATSSKNLQLTALSKATHDRTYEHPSYMQKLNHILGSTIPAK
ncbi:MAG: dienelactone hydrolase family protein, partial [Simkaniaceae bacterium]|nr:dienelactone hydrolase family protein [Simkaniaceae bacterium]